MSRNAFQFSHGMITGVDMSVPAFRLSSQFATRAVNRTFRNGGNDTRHGWSEVEMFFETAADRQLFETGNMQGFHAYTPTGLAQDSGLMVAVGGTVFHGQIAGTSIRWVVIDRDLEPLALNVVFAQGEEQVYWQDGLSKPRGWGGLNTEVRILEPSDKQMPIGVLMTYAHGRIVVVTEEGAIIISDHFNGRGFGYRTNMDNFTEHGTTLGGYFFAPSNMGRARMLTVAPYNNNWFAQGELVIGYEDGFASMDISGSRASWESPRVTFTGAGAAGSRAFCHANSEIWYRRHDGVGAYRQSAQDFQRGMETPISDNVRPILDTDTPALLRFIPMAHFDSRIYIGAQPKRDVIDGRWHLYCEKMVVADIASGTAASGDRGFAWEGEWEGLRPFAMAKLAAEGISRLFVVDRMQSGINRIVEAVSAKIDISIDAGVQSWKKIESSFRVPNATSGEHFLGNYRMTGIGKVGLIHRGSFTVSATFRPDSMPLAAIILPETGTDGADCTTSCDGNSYNFFPIRRFLRTSSVDHVTCVPFAKTPILNATWSEIEYNFIGDVTFVGAVHVAEPVGEATSCIDNDIFDYSSSPSNCPNPNQ